MQRIYFSLFLLLTLPIWWACEATSSTAPTPVTEGEEHDLYMTAEQRSLAGIVIGTPQKRQLSTTIDVTGMVDVPPQSRASLYPPIHGYVQSVRHYPGSAVRKGELLATLRHPDILTKQQQLIEAQADVQYWDAEKQRQQQLVTGEVGANKSLQEAKTAFTKANARFEALYAEIEFWGINMQALLNDGILQPELRLTAPIDGYITAIQAHIGAFVEPNQPLYKLIDNSHLHLELAVFAKDLHRIKKGQHVTFQLPQQSTIYHGEVHLIGKEVAPDMKTVNIHVHYNEAAIPLTPGTYVTAQITVKELTSWAVPPTAIIQENGSPYVYRVIEEAYHKTPVALNYSSEDWAGISFSDNDYQTPVVLEGAYYVKGFAEQEDMSHGH